MGYNPRLVVGVGFRLRKRRQRQIKHAPGRFHSGAQVVKETEQAPPPLADVAWLRIRANARLSAAGFRFNIKEIRND
jgi:hypothetical protein